MAQTGELTRLLQDWRRGDDEALETLIPKIYDSLQQVARGYLWRERQGHTLQATALVHEAFLRLRDSGHIDWQSRAHFVAIAARQMRQILVDHARVKAAQKRGGDLERVPLESADPASEGDTDIRLLDQALNKLAATDQRQARVVELRYFGGLSVRETGELLEVSPATVKREWATAKAWLWAEMQGVER